MDVFFTLPPGWQPLVNDAVAKMKALTSDFNLEIKEKWGRLDFVFYGEAPEQIKELQAIADAAEEKSKHVCAICGKYEDQPRQSPKIACNECAGRSSE